MSLLRKQIKQKNKVKENTMLVEKHLSTKLAVVKSKRGNIYYIINYPKDFSGYNIGLDYIGLINWFIEIKWKSSVRRGVSSFTISKAYI